MAKKKCVWVSLRVNRSITKAWPAAYDMFHALETPALQMLFDSVPLVGDNFRRDQMLETEVMKAVLSDAQRRALEQVDRFVVVKRTWVRLGKNEHFSLFIELNGVQVTLPGLEAVS